MAGPDHSSHKECPACGARAADWAHVPRGKTATQLAEERDSNIARARSELKEAERLQSLCNQLVNIAAMRVLNAQWRLYDAEKQL